MMCVWGVVVAQVDVNNPMPFAESLKISADAINKSLPTMLDAELRHDKVEIDKNTMTFKFTLVNFTQKEMGAEKLKELMEADIKQGVCVDKDSQMMLKRGIKMVYDYTDKNKQHITHFDYDAKVCGLTTNIETT